MVLEFCGEVTQFQATRVSAIRGSGQLNAFLGRRLSAGSASCLTGPAHTPGGILPSLDNLFSELKRLASPFWVGELGTQRLERSLH